MTQKTNPWTFDVRVRERDLKSGALNEKDVEKYLQALPDLADQTASFSTAQPALEEPAMAADLDDEEDDEDEDDEDDARDTAVEAAPAAAVNDPAPAPSVPDVGGETDGTPS